MPPGQSTHPLCLRSCLESATLVQLRLLQSEREKMNNAAGEERETMDHFRQFSEKQVVSHMNKLSTMKYTVYTDNVIACLVI